MFEGRRLARIGRANTRASSHTTPSMYTGCEGSPREPHFTVTKTTMPPHLIVVNSMEALESLAQYLRSQRRHVYFAMLT